jgi:hypothetical protein
VQRREAICKRMAKRLVLYQDDQFAKEKMWGFFALNFSERRKNQLSGVFSVDTWFKDGDVSVEELKKKVSKR